MEENLEIEIWKDVSGYEGLYQVSSFGRVWSLPKERVGINGVRRKYNGKLITSSKSSNGYSSVMLYKEGKGKTIMVHTLVAMVFLGHKPNGMGRVVDHIDNNPLNNNVSNLQLITHRENISKDRVGSSKFTGVTWHKKASKWRSCIQINGQRIHLGLFIDEEEAGQMYQAALSNIDKYKGDVKEFRYYLQSIS